MGKQANNPHPVTYQSMTPMTTQGSTHISGYSWLSACYPRRGNIQTEGVRFTFNNDKHIIHQQNLTT